MTAFLVLDSQRRISLGRIAQKGVTGFLAEQRDDGSIVLTPATPIADVEVSPRIVHEARQGLAAIADGHGIRFDSQAQLAPVAE